LEKRNVALNNLVTPTPKDKGESPWGQGNEVWNDSGDEDIMKETQLKIAKDISKLHEGVIDGWFAQAGSYNNNQCWIYLLVDPSKRLNISPIVADAWGINLDKFVVVSLTFSSLYLDSVAVPAVTCFQSGKSGVSKLDGTELADKSKWGLDWTVSNIIKTLFFTKYWPISKNYDAKKFQDKNYLYALLHTIEDTIKNCASKCVICGDALAYAGIKPVACEKAICIFSYEQFGLGVDIESQILKYPDIIDLSITLAIAACEIGTINPFEPYPEGLEVTTKNKDTGKETKYDLKRKDENDNSKMKDVLDKFPAVAEMKKWCGKGVLREELDKLHPLCWPVLRWLIASNRCYLKKLTEKESIGSMNTEHQYLMLAGTPEKEKRFREMKKQYGSVWAFHGSALSSWHSIMRKGLKNMSGTKGQINGAAYGSGVYFANDANTSFGYMKFVACWSKSIFYKEGSQLGVLSMNELAVGHPDLANMPNPYYVVAKEDLIATRYFFLYPGGSGSSDVCGKDLKVPEVKF
jgi:hypothetical protein